MKVAPLAGSSVSGHYRALDGVRGLAAVLVVLLHAEWPNHITNNRFVQNGYLAVDLFFILSGLVIASNYSARIADVRDLQRFGCLRFFRLYPLHLALLVAFVVLECAKLGAEHLLGVAPGGQAPFTHDSSLPALAANLFLVQGLHVLHRTTWNGPSWSISCEFAAYLAFGLAVLTGATRRRRFYAIGVLLAASGYAALVIARGSLDVQADWGVVRCFAGFFIGMLIFELTPKGALRLSRRLAATCEIAVVGAALLTMSLAPGRSIVIIIPLFALAVVLLQSDSGPVGRLLSTQPAQYLGRISYSIYMVHDLLVVSLLIVLKRIFVAPLGINSLRTHPVVMINPWIGDLLVIGLLFSVLATATLTYTFIEDPGRRFGRRLADRLRTPHSDHAPGRSLAVRAE